MIEKFLKRFEIENKTREQIQFLNPLILAYIGDAIYELYVRTYILHKYGGSVNDLHRLSIKFVKAGAQAKIVHELEKEFFEDEWTTIKRGRNHKSGYVPKNASVIDYKYATGFETLIGYLYLMENNERLEEILYKAVVTIEENAD